MFPCYKGHDRKSEIGLRKKRLWCGKPRRAEDKSPVRSGLGGGQVALTVARPHGTLRFRAGSRRLAWERQHPHLAFGPAGLGLGPAGLHGLGHTLWLRGVAVCCCQTPAIHASRPVPASCLSRDGPSATKRREAAAGTRTGCDLEQTSQELLAREGPAHPRSGPAHARPSPRLRSRPLCHGRWVRRRPQGGTRSSPLPPQPHREVFRLHHAVP